MNNNPYEKLARMSNSLYNDGLEKAKVHDLSGAANSLRKSLMYNKNNTEARNLLGLVYYEQGEVVSALCEWVISRNLDNYENDADYFLERIQDDRDELDNYNQAVRKYNLALEAAKEGNTDTAIIQLKKVVAACPRFLRAVKLLGLLYIREEEYVKAKKTLIEARNTDRTDTDTLKYIAYIDSIYTPEPQRGFFIEARNNPPVTDFDDELGVVGQKKGFFSTLFNERKPDLMLFTHLILGLLIGIAVVYYLIVPSEEAKIREEYNNSRVDYSAELSAKNAALSQQDKEITTLRKEVAELKSQLNGISYETIEIAVGDETFSAFFDIWNEYNEMVARDYTDEELVDLAMELWSLDFKGIRSKYAQDILTKMRDEIYPIAAKKVYRKGKDYLDNEDIDNAIRFLTAASELDPKSDVALYYLGKALEDNGQYTEAITNYRQMLTVSPGSTLRDYIPQRLEACEQAIAKAKEEAANTEADEDED